MPAGRPTKLTPALQQKVCDALRSGNVIDTAAAFAGIDRTTLYNWLRRGEGAAKGIYRDFRDAVGKARADAEARDVALIGKAAAEGNWQAAAWRLERRFPEHWGRKDRVEATVRGAVSHVDLGRVDLSSLSEEELRALEAIYKKILSGPPGGAGTPPGPAGTGTP